MLNLFLEDIFKTSNALVEIEVEGYNASTVTLKVLAGEIDCSQLHLSNFNCDIGFPKPPLDKVSSLLEDQSLNQFTHKLPKILIKNKKDNHYQNLMTEEFKRKYLELANKREQ